jgi:putative spermidine/putrescine transport system substrate-binding protein
MRRAMRHAFKGAKPNSWADFWDMTKFPGPRTMPAGSGGLTPDLEAATLATGVPLDKICPIDIDKAYASLAKIKPAVVKWWEAGAIPAQMLSDNEVAMAVAWNGRIAAIQEQGAPVAIGWRQGGLRTDAWAVPKGAPNRENAMKFTAFITLPIPQARLSMSIPYGFVNNKAADYITQERLAVLPTAPEIRDELYAYNAEWWADKPRQGD